MFKKHITALLFLVACLPAFAERINAPVEVYEEPGKQTYAQLYIGSSIYVESQSDGWAKIIAVVTATRTGFDTYTLQLPKKTILYDAQGQATGQLFGKTKLPAGYTYDTKTVVFELTGYIRITEIDTNWVPENTFTYLIDSAKSKIGYKDLKPDFERYRFYLQMNDSSGFTCYQLDDTAGLNYKNPKERLRFVFYQNRLVAIFHKKPFRLKSKEVIIIDGRENLIFLRDLNADEKRTFSTLFLE